VPRKLTTGEPQIPDELRDELDAQLVEYVKCIRKERSLKGEVQARSAELRFRMGEMFREANEKVAALARRRKAIVDHVIRTWDKHFPELNCADFPSTRAIRTTVRDLKILDKRAVIDALDRLDRLDLIDTVIDESGLLKLSRSGALAGLPPEALKVKDKPQLQVRLKPEVD